MAGFPGNQETPLATRLLPAHIQHPHMIPGSTRHPTYQPATHSPRNSRKSRPLSGSTTNQIESQCLNDPSDRTHGIFDSTQHAICSAATECVLSTKHRSHSLTHANSRAHSGDQPLLPSPLQHNSPVKIYGLHPINKVFCMMVLRKLILSYSFRNHNHTNKLHPQFNYYWSHPCNHNLYNSLKILKIKSCHCVFCATVAFCR